ncbi:SusC/RagA family TonB-linked outer membrane protein [Flavobacterium sp.]|uniref:SusC/RagA family TonB-linked outer membrane protein n=1 Tax=Flavobacterium sp. TaxID=239 RepID=UPI00326501D5
MKIKLLKKRIKYSFVFLFFMNFLLINSMSAQTSVVEGKITDAAGLSLPGVNIQEKGTKTGTSTDFEGSFKINVSNNKAILVISYLGFQTQEVSVAGKSKVNVSLSEQSNSLSEVVVVGYGKVKKKDLTGTVSTIQAEAITERNTTNALQALQGAVPGVQIQNTSGRVGDPVKIVIRGNNSLTSGGSNPLFVIDGVFSDNMDFLNPQDISRMDILKDASSTAIYGSRGSNGVVIVTTKSGSTAKSGLTVSFDSYVGSKEVARLPKLMSGAEFAKFNVDAFIFSSRLSANTPDTATNLSIVRNLSLGDPATRTQMLYRSRVANNETFDWQKALLKTGIQQNNYLSVSGKSKEGLAYNFGLGVQSESGNVINEDLTRYTYKLGLDHKINDKFSLGTNITLARTNQQLGSDTAMSLAFAQNPFATPYDQNGNLLVAPSKVPDPLNPTLNIFDKTSAYNPLLEIANTNNKVSKLNIIGNFYVEYKPLSWLTFKSAYSAGYEDYKQATVWGAQTTVGVQNKNLGMAHKRTLESFNSTWDNQFNIDYKINDVHNFNLLGLITNAYEKDERFFAASGQAPFDLGSNDFPSGLPATYTYVDPLNTSKLPNYASSSLSSYAVRFNYGFKSKYLLTLSQRWDGSSRFADGNKWGSFPSGAFAWRLSEEDFMKKQNVVSDFKLRVSYGFTGNNKIDPYSTINKVDSQSYYNLGNGYYPNIPGNQNLKWEKTRELNIGADFGFLENRITGSVDVYDRLSDDLLYSVKIPNETGFSNYLTNLGSVSNKGVEVSLTTKNIQTDFVTWETSFNFTKNVNKIISITDKVTNDVGNKLFIGEATEVIYNYKYDGVRQASEVQALLAALPATATAAQIQAVKDLEGQAKVVDTNNDGKFDSNDRQILGNVNPDWTGGVSTKLTVGNFDLSANAVISQGGMVQSQFHKYFADITNRGNQRMAGLDYYVPENGAGLTPNYTNAYPQILNGGAFWANDGGIAYYKDISYVKIQNIALGYTFKSDVVQKFKMKYLRIYANVSNPFVFTKYDGYDPEWAAASLNVSRVASISYQLGFSFKF